MNDELSTLISDIKEQILYLQEIGAENLSVDLPEISFAPRPQLPVSKPSIAPERLEKFVPEDILPKIVAEKSKIETNEAAEARPSRLSLLESTKLSRLPTLPKRNSFVPKNEEQGEKSPMPKQKVMPEEALSNTLFGDITQALPEATETIEEIRADCGNCTRCPLHQGRTKIVHTTGNFQADLMFIGEAPGANEDAQGEPFVGRAGQLLDKIIEAIGQKRPDVAIGNVNRCRPPGNRQPLQVEADVCKQFLIREIAVIRPKVIVVLGNTAMQNLLNIKTGITKMRGNFQDYYGVKVMPTFHPAYLLRDPSKKRETWEDMKKVRDYLSTLK